MESAPQRSFHYRAVKPDGEAIAETLAAHDRRDALRRLAERRFVVTDLREAAADDGWRAPRVTSGERILALRHLATMLQAGVELLEALDIAASAHKRGPMRTGLEATGAALRRGESVARAFAEAMPFYPPYVVALIGAGEASGRLARVIAEASEQLAFEERVRRDVINALTYPAFLLVAGALAAGFLFYAVVPQFADMAAAQGAEVGGFAGLVLDLGRFVRASALALVLAIALGGAAVAINLRRPSARDSLLSMLARAPILGGLLEARQRARWTRLMALASGAGVGLLEAVRLAAAAEGAARSNTLAGVEAALASGKPIEAAFAQALSPMDLSLLRVGQRASALPQAFGAIAQSYEEFLRDGLKRLTALLEPISIAIIALTIGAVVLSLVTAMTGLYESIG